MANCICTDLSVHGVRPAQQRYFISTHASWFHGRHAKTFWPALSRAFEYLGEQQQKTFKGFEVHNLPSKFIPIHPWVTRDLAVSRELCATVIKKHSEKFLEDLACFCS